jgi:hypothetical protein
MILTGENRRSRRKTCPNAIIKLKLSHYRPRMHMGGEKVWPLLILNLGTRWGKRSESRPGRALAPCERTPGTHFSGGWVGPRAGLDTEARGKILSPLPGIEPRSSGRPCCSRVTRLAALHKLSTVSRVTWFSSPVCNLRLLGFYVVFSVIMGARRSVMACRGREWMTWLVELEDDGRTDGWLLAGWVNRLVASVCG